MESGVCPKLEMLYVQTTSHVRDQMASGVVQARDAICSVKHSWLADQIAPLLS